MEVTATLKERFCKDMNIPIRIFEEPYFESRLKLYDVAYGTLAKYQTFLDTLANFRTEQDYFTAYNKLKDEAMAYLREQPAMQRFVDEDMLKYVITHEKDNFPSKDIFKQSFDKRTFISIDMKKANFTALRHYDASIVGGKDTYEDFIGMFTPYEYFKESKYIRQVIFGNVNPRRQVRYEKYLMDGILTELLKFTPIGAVQDMIVFFSNDEIVVDITDLSASYARFDYSSKVQTLLDAKQKEGINLRQEMFVLEHIKGTDGYVRRFINKSGYDLKCVDGFILPFVLRAFAGEEPQEEDLVFRYEGRLAKLLEIPEIKVV